MPEAVISILIWLNPDRGQGISFPLPKTGRRLRRGVVTVLHPNRWALSCESGNGRRYSLREESSYPIGAYSCIGA